MKWKCQNFNKCSDVSGLCPSSVNVRYELRHDSFFLCLFPSQSLIPRARASAMVCPLELKCSATGKPGALLLMLRRFHQNVPSEQTEEEGIVAQLITNIHWWRAQSRNVWTFVKILALLFPSSLLFSVTVNCYIPYHGWVLIPPDHSGKNQPRFLGAG